VPSAIDETLPAGPPLETVPALALAKARAVLAAGVGGVVLAADTVVVVDDQVLGKPADADDARRMLRRLRDRAHDVITGVAVIDAARGREATTAVVTRVVMAGYDDAALEAYVATGGPLDKAGGYAIQDIPAAWVREVVGPYSNVVGLPLAATGRLLADFAVPLLPGALSADDG
jgi:nucleoside triphosphate pyrophosphatase